MQVMKSVMRNALVTLFASLLFAPSAFAYNAVTVKILKVSSPNQYGHLYVDISTPSNCPDNPQAYFIINGWGEQSEPALTNRKAMLAIVLTAFAAGKTVTVYGVDCYLNKYLFADQVTVNE